MAAAEISLEAFLSHIARVAIEVKHAEHVALEAGARLIEAEAKREIGEQQGPAEPFAAWAELAEATKDERGRLGFAENEPGLRTGEMRDSISHIVVGKEAVVGSNDDKLVWFELGDDHQPPRSVLGSAAVHKAPDIARLFGSAARMALIGEDVADGAISIP